MMIPPLVRIGPVPRDSGGDAEYVVLFRGAGWQHVRWTDKTGMPMLERVRSGILQYPENALCWMPQDGT